MTIGEQLKEKRTEKKLTQEQLSEKILVSRKTISNWETGKTMPDIDSLIRLATLFNLSLDNLLLEENDLVVNISKKEKAFKIQRWGSVIPSITILILSIYITLSSLNEAVFTIFYGKYVMFCIIFLNLAIDFFISSLLKKNNITDYETRFVKYTKMVIYILFSITLLVPIVVDIITKMMNLVI